MIGKWELQIGLRPSTILPYTGCNQSTIYNWKVQQIYNLQQILWKSTTLINFCLQSTIFFGLKIHLQSTIFLPLWSTIYNKNLGQIYNLHLGQTPPWRVVYLIYTTINMSCSSFWRKFWVIECCLLELSLKSEVFKCTQDTFSRN